MPDHATTTRADSLQAQISDAVIAVVRDYTGRGPTKVRTVIGSNVVLVILEDTLTKGERALAQNHEAEAVRTMRRSFQQAMRGDLVKAVERLMQQRVHAFLSDQSVDPDVSIEAFVLEPAGDRS
jgi:uncharacterized protein YbcI